MMNNNAGDCTLLHVLSLCSSLFLLKFIYYHEKLEIETTIRTLCTSPFFCFYYRKEGCNHHFYDR